MIANMLTQHLSTLAPGAIARDALQATGLDWSVEKRPVYLGSGQVIPKKWATVRSSDGAPLGVVGDRYQVLDHTDALSLFDPFVGAGLRYANAGTFRGGALVYVQAEMPGGAVSVAGDEHRRYLTLVASHDGTRAMSIFLTAVRIVCTNTLMAALREGRNGGAFTFRHTASSADRLAIAGRALAAADAEFTRFGALAERLRLAPFSRQDAIDLVEYLAPTKSDGGEASTRTRNVRAQIIDLTETGIGLGAHRGTAWAAVNAVTQYVDHERPSRAGGRELSAMFGTGAKMKADALSWIVGRAVGSTSGPIPLLPAAAPSMLD